MVVSAVADALARGRGCHKHEAVALVKRLYAGSPLFGRPCYSRTAMTLLRRARDLLIERAGSSREEQRMLSFAFYESIIRDPEASLTQKMKARTRLDRLLGLVPRQPRRPVRQADTAPAGVPATLVVTRGPDASEVLNPASHPGGE